MDVLISYEIIKAQISLYIYLNLNIQLVTVMTVNNVNYTSNH